MNENGENYLSLEMVNESNLITDQAIIDEMANQDPCRFTRMAKICRDVRRGIECVYPYRGRAYCYRYRR